MKRLPALFVSVLASTWMVAGAADVRVETDRYTLVVSRPLDTWSPEAWLQEMTKSGFEKKRVAYAVKYGSATLNPCLALMCFGSGYDHPVLVAIGKELSLNGLKPSASNPYYSVEVGAPVRVDPEDLGDVDRVEAAMLQQVAEVQGDPKALEAKVANRRMLGNVVGALTTVVAAGAMGVGNGVAAVVGAGWTDLASTRIGNSVGQYAVPHTGSFADLKDAKVIDFRRVTTGRSMAGQIVIAYKVDKTPEMEVEALAKGVALALGAQTTPEQVDASRTADLQLRTDIWRKCVAEGRCGPDGKVAGASSASVAAVQ